MSILLGQMTNKNLVSVTQFINIKLNKCMKQNKYL